MIADTPRMATVRNVSMWHVFRTWILPCVVPLSILVLWHVAASLQWLAPQILPAPTLTFDTFLALAQDNLWQDIGASLKRLLLGLTPALTVGLVIGSLMGLSKRIDRLLSLTVHIWAQIPNLALIPILMVFLGIGEGLKAVAIFNAAVTPMLIYAHAGMRNMPSSLQETAAVLRFNALQRLRLLYLPAALPSLTVGLRLSLSASWTSLVVVELLASSDGIGSLLVWGRQMFQLDIVFVCIVMIGLLGLCSEWLVQQIDQRLVRWPRPALSRHIGNVHGDRQWQAWLLPVLLLMSWWSASHLQWIDTDTLPTPLAVLQALHAGINDGTLSSSLISSMRRYLQGLALGAAAGMAVGLAAGLWPTFGRLIMPTFNTLRNIVIFAWLPLLTAWTGTGEAARVVFIAIASFFPILLATQKGVANLPAPLTETATALRLNFRQRVRWLVLPGIVPSLFAGLRLGLIHGWLATIGAEFFMASSIGIGSLMINAQQLMLTDVIFAGLILVSVTGVILNRLGRWLEYRSQKWRFQ